ncbi:MAG: HEAT repeat domain-containing protein [Elusimicrobia bacterium]|nr:HEAT repeat domain-containing protein [Candidatus Obscuribacterium magneticum]
MKTKIIKVLFLISILSCPGIGRSASPGNSKKPDPYREGVQAYLDGNDDAAIRFLEEAIRVDNNSEKARRLLLRAFIRTIQNGKNDKDSEYVRILIYKAQQYFPGDAQIKDLSESILPPVESIRNRPSNYSQKEAPKRKRKNDSPPPAASSSEVETAKGIPYAPHAPPVPVTQKPAPSTEAAREAPLFQGRSFFIIIVFACLMLAGLFLFALRSYQRTVLEQTRMYQEAMQKGEAEKAALRKDLEARQEAERRANEMAKLKKEEEQRLILELEKKKREEERKLMSELAQKRRQEEERLRNELAERYKTAGSQKEAVLPPPAPSLQHSMAKRQEEHILGLTVNIPPPERGAAWNRIADQALSLYETSTEEAIKFLNGLSGDENPWTRASIVLALTRIGVPETLDILFKLRDDPSPDVQREVLKNLKNLERVEKTTLPDSYRQKVKDSLTQEKEKGEWVL